MRPLTFILILVAVPETSAVVLDSLRQACDELQILEVRLLLGSVLITLVSSSLAAEFLYSMEIRIMKIPYMRHLAPLSHMETPIIKPCKYPYNNFRNDHDSFNFLLSGHKKEKEKESYLSTVTSNLTYEFSQISE